ncbi:hypothetical protein NQZ68_033693 [Dissostichus eleginoides]|nr:hypothetical protein NQZ68_033693 [Dissostichus eleginoides]
MEWLLASGWGLLPPGVCCCAEEDLPRLGPAFHLSCFCCCGGLLPPVVCCGVVCCFAEETFYPGDTTERPERFHAAAFACPLLLC